jgi:glycosyltransferase involved in cell wall biosynthesis
MPAEVAAENSPLLAVVISCWNYETYVVRAIRSVLAQTDTRCELVVVDDGSTDGSWDAICREGVTAYRISNSGQRAACLYGLDRTRARFILFLDADDELAPGSLARIIALLDADVAKLQFSLTRIDQDGGIISRASPKLEAFRSRNELADLVLRSGSYTTPPTSGNVFRRDVCEHLREAVYDRAVDGIILFVAPFMGDVVSLSDELGRYRIHDRNDSGLGRQIDARSLRRDLSRFVERLDHLCHILARDGSTSRLVKPEETYFYQERSFYLAIAEGRRIPWADVWRLLKCVWQHPSRVMSKASMSAFVILTATLPSQQARRALAYRLGSGRRSALGLLHALF